MGAQGGILFMSSQEVNVKLSYLLQCCTKLHVYKDHVGTASHEAFKDVCIVMFP